MTGDAKVTNSKNTKFNSTESIVHKPQFKILIFYIIFILFGTIYTLYGVNHAKVLKNKTYDIEVSKHVEGLTKLKISLVSDLHLGRNIRFKEIRKMVNRINQSNPDIVVVAGDIFNNDYDDIVNPDGIIKELRNIKSQYGTYAVFGNHDIKESLFFGFTRHRKDSKVADDRMYEFVDKAGIKLLEDEYELIDNKFYLYGRPDYSKPGKHVSIRKTPKEITSNLDLAKPVIVIDHEPAELKELAMSGVDIDLSGHTHNGQIWPLHIPIYMIWDNPYGYKEYGKMHSIVTSGVGVYGPYMRVGSTAEVVTVNVTFK